MRRWWNSDCALSSASHALLRKTRLCCEKTTCSPRTELYPRLVLVSEGNDKERCCSFLASRALFPVCAVRFYDYHTDRSCRVFSGCCREERGDQSVCTLSNRYGIGYGTRTLLARPQRSCKCPLSNSRVRPVWRSRGERACGTRRALSSFHTLSPLF